MVITNPQLEAYPEIYAVPSFPGLTSRLDIMPVLVIFFCSIIQAFAPKNHGERARCNGREQHSSTLDDKNIEVATIALAA